MLGYFYGGDESSLIIKQDGHLLFLGKAYGPPEYRESKLGQGLGVMLGVLRDVRLVVLPLWAYGAVHRVALGVGPGENGILVGLPRQLVQLLQFLPQPAHRADHRQVVGGQRGLKEEGVRQRQSPGSPTEQGPHPRLVRCEMDDQRMLPKIPVLLHDRRHRLPILWQAATSNIAPKASPRRCPHGCPGRPARGTHARTHQNTAGCVPRRPPSPPQCRSRKRRMLHLTGLSPSGSFSLLPSGSPPGSQEIFRVICSSGRPTPGLRVMARLSSAVKPMVSPS